MEHELDLLLVEVFPHPVSAVWEALTDPAALREWLMPCDFEALVGHRFIIEGDATESWRGWTRCEVIAIEPFRRMEWLWESADIPAPTRVSFELTPVEGGTRLTLRHSGRTSPGDIANLSQGWPVKLGQLLAWLAGR